MSEKYTPTNVRLYPNYFVPVVKFTHLDVYLTHTLFGVTDNLLHHASKKILLSGRRSGNKSMYKDIKEAKDTLSTWLEHYENGVTQQQLQEVSNGNK